MILARENQRFLPNFFWSFGLHCLFILLMFVLSTWWASRGRLSIDSAQLKALQSAVRVDVVGMPTLTKKELESLVDLTPPKRSEPAAQTIKAEAEGKAPEVVDKDIKTGEPVQYAKTDEGKKRNKFLSLVKGMGKQDVPTSKNTNIDSTNEEGRDVTLAGNKLSQGSAVTGNVTSDQLDATTLYLDSVRARLKSFWKLPSYLREKNLTCRALVMIGPAGELVSAKIYQTSGAFDYDDKVIETINRAAPFGTPPEVIRVKLATGGVVFGFPL